MGELFDYERPDKYIVSSERYSNEYPTPVLTANQSFILGYTNETDGICENIPVVLFDDFTCDTKFVDFPFKVKSSAMKLLRSSKRTDINFTYALLQHINYQPQGHSRHWISVMQPIQVAVPSYSEQKKIATVFELINRRIQKQTKMIDALKKYKRGLLSGVFDETANNIEYDTATYSFYEIASRRKEKYNPASGTCFPCVELEHLEQETGRILGSVPSEQQNSIKTVCKIGDTMFGKLRPYLRKYAYANINMVCSSEIWSLIPSDIVVPKYLFYLVQTEQFIRAANISSGTKMPRAEWTSVEKSVFNIPPKSTQERIVSLFEGIDKKLDNAQETLIMLENYKLGLLQQLFI